MTAFFFKFIIFSFFLPLFFILALYYSLFYKTQVIFLSKKKKENFVYLFYVGTKKEINIRIEVISNNQKTKILYNNYFI